MSRLTESRFNELRADPAFHTGRGVVHELLDEIQAAWAEIQVLTELVQRKEALQSGVGQDAKPAAEPTVE